MTSLDQFLQHKNEHSYIASYIASYVATHVIGKNWKILMQNLGHKGQDYIAHITACITGHVPVLLHLHLFSVFGHFSAVSSQNLFGTCQWCSHGSYQNFAVIGTGAL